MTWLALGSGPSAPVELERFEASDVEVDASITCNAGIKLLPRPTYYQAVDQIASREHEQAARDAQAAGATLVTLRRDPDAQRERHCDHYDLQIDENPKALPHVGGYGKFRLSGPLMLEVALNHGATEIHLVGFDGYSRTIMNYFDSVERGLLVGQIDKKHAHVQLCHRVTEEALGLVAAAWGHCRFIQHGPTTFAISAPNWERVD